MTSMTLDQAAETAETAYAAPTTEGARILSEVRRFLGKFTVASDSQLWALTFWCAHSYVLEQFTTTPRLLLTSKAGGCGKTETLMRVMSLSQNGWRGRGTKEAIRAKFGEVDRPTVCVDEISDIFGKSGRSGATHPLGSILREGYKRGATDSFSVNRVAEEISTYAAVALAGRGNAVPDDILQRCIRIVLTPGRPACEYEFREHDDQAARLGLALGQWVKKNADRIGEYRARPTQDPRLVGRLRETWEPLLAIGHVGGAEMFRHALSACLDIGLDQADEIVLTPAQTVLRDMCKAADVLERRDNGTDGGFALGADMREEMRRFGEPMYEPMPDRSLSMAMAEAVPESAQRIAIVGGRRGRGYVLSEIRREWSMVAPAAALPQIADAELPDPDAVELVG